MYIEESIKAYLTTTEPWITYMKRITWVFHKKSYLDSYKPAVFRLLSQSDEYHGLFQKSDSPWRSIITTQLCLSNIFMIFDKSYLFILLQEQSEVNFGMWRQTVFWRWICAKCETVSLEVNCRFFALIKTTKSTVDTLRETNLKKNSHTCRSIPIKMTIDAQLHYEEEHAASESSLWRVWSSQFVFKMLILGLLSSFARLWTRAWKNSEYKVKSTVHY